MPEKKTNIRFVCDEHASKPNLAFAKKPLKSFVGAYVKKAFPIRRPTDNAPLLEHMWVKVLAVKTGALVGILDNEPIGVTKLKHGDEVRVKRSEIEEVLR